MKLNVDPEFVQALFQGRAADMMLDMGPGKALVECNRLHIRYDQLHHRMVFMFANRDQRVMSGMADYGFDVTRASDTITLNMQFYVPMEVK